MSDVPIWQPVAVRISRAVDATGTLTALLTLAAFGLCALAVGPARAGLAALAVFGLAGAAEVFHRQRQAELVQRCQLPDPSGLLFAALRAKKWNPKVLDQFEHGGLCWHVLGFEEVQLPFGIGGPQCPSCGKHVSERVSVRFPGRLRIQLCCRCGFAAPARHTIAELRREAAELANLPR